MTATDVTGTAFERDIAAQADVLQDVLAWYGTAHGQARLAAALDLADGASRVLMVGMGSSLAAAIPATALLARHRPAYAFEAGDVLHYGLDDIASDALVVVASQSGRSVETLAVTERLAARGHARLCAVSNDADSPMARSAAVTLPILAGEEATVSTKTFLNSLVVMRLLAATIAAGAPVAPHAVVPPGLADQVAVAASLEREAEAVAAAMRDCVSVSLTGRGPSAVAADYGALILKESVAIPCEAFSGGSFRHGPLETAGPALGLIVLAPSGPTRELGIRLALDASQLGSPTWLIADDGAGLPSDTDRLRVTTLPAVDEAFAPYLSSVLIQRLAAALARQRGRVPGVLLRSSKVTETE